MARNDEKHLFLDDVVGWHRPGAPQVRSGAWRQGLSLALPRRHLTLEPLPGPAEALPETLALRCPSAVASWSDPCVEKRCLLVVDAAKARVALFDVLTGKESWLPAIGGLGTAPRALREPRGLAVQSTEALVVADTGNHRLQIFAPPTWALLRVIGAVDRLGRPRPGGGKGGFTSPWAVAVDALDRLWVVDRGNRRLVVLDADGSWLTELGAGQLDDPMRIAIGPAGEVAVLDRTPDGGVVKLLVPSPHWGTGQAQAPARAAQNAARPPGWASRRARGLSLARRVGGAVFVALSSRADLLSVAFDPCGRLYAGDAIGRVHVWAPAEATASPQASHRDAFLTPSGVTEGSQGFQPMAGVPMPMTWIGSSATELDGGVVDLAWEGDGLIAVIRSKTVEHGVEKLRQALWRLPAERSFVRQGVLLTQALDSGIEDCVWHRIALQAAVPSGTSIELATYSAARADGLSGVEDPMDPGFTRWRSCGVSGDPDPDGLVQSPPGRFLWLRVTLRSNGRATPSLGAIKAQYPRRGYLSYLPAVYQENEESRLFLERFLALFQTELDGLDLRVDRLWQLFDPASVPRQHLRWLAGWLGVVLEAHLGEDDQRRLIAEAHLAQRRRGTRAGLEEAIAAHGGVAFARILEHYKLRRWPLLTAAASLGEVRLFSRDFYRRLQVGSYSQVGKARLLSRPEPALEALDWGAHRFSVFFPANPYRVAEARERLAAVVEREKPAHTTATVCPVLPRLRLGVQATIGIDAVVGGVSHLVLGHLSTLSYDTILAGSTVERELRAQGVTPRPRAGLSTRLR